MKRPRKIFGKVRVEVGETRYTVRQTKVGLLIRKHHGRDILLAHSVLISLALDEKRLAEQNARDVIKDCPGQLKMPFLQPN